MKRAFLKKVQDLKRDKIDFKEVDVKLATMVLDKTRDIYSYFKYLKKERDLPFAIVLIKSDNLKEIILKEKRETDVYVDLDIVDMNLIFLPVTKDNECDGFIRRMMSGINETSGDFAAAVGVKKNVDLEEAVFPLLVDYFTLLKQPTEWRTGQISYKEI